MLREESVLGDYGPAAIIERSRASPT